MKSYIRTIDTAYALFMVLYPSQTTILEGWTEDEIRISEEALFKGVSTQSGLHLLIILPKASFREHIFVTIITRDSRWRHEEDIWRWYDARYKYHSENFMLPKTDLGRSNQPFRNVFSKHVSRAWALYLGYEAWKSASKTLSGRFVKPSKTFVWEG